MGTHIPPVINRDCSNGSTVSLMLGNHVRRHVYILWHTQGLCGSISGKAPLQAVHN